MSEPVFASALGAGFTRMPAIVREVHAPAPSIELSGRADIEGAAGLFAKTVALLFGFPRSQSDAEARVRIEQAGDAEIWTRTFGATFRSRVAATGEPGRLTERFGPVTFDLAITADETGFSLAVLGWRFLGLPVPARLAPTTMARGFARDDGAYGFDIEIRLPGGARLVRYSGWLRPI